MKLQAPVLIADTSTLLNLYASDKFEDILKAIPCPVTIVENVLKETQYILREGLKESKEIIELEPYISKGLLSVSCFGSDDEKARFIQFTQELDDGEAATGAIAFHRKWDIAIDDKKGRAVFAREIPSSICVSTLEIVEHTASSLMWDNETLMSTIKKISLQARFRPHKGCDLENWWNEYLMK